MGRRLGKFPNAAPQSWTALICEMRDFRDEEVSLRRRRARKPRPWLRSRATAASARRALTPAHFLLLYAAMLVAAAGNTALQSVMPAIGREIGIDDFYVAIAYTWSAVLVGAARPLLGGEERPSRD